MPTLIKNRQIVDGPSPLPDLVLEPSDDPALIAAALGEARVIAVRFPKFADGRGYSIGRLLRERYGYRGELRAVGAVARDHLHLLAQCGFDAFQLREGEDPQEAVRGLDDFSATYQARATHKAPIRGRRSDR